MSEQDLQESGISQTNEWNEFRCYAAEIVVRLYKAKQVGQLELLELQIKRSLEELKKESK